MTEGGNGGEHDGAAPTAPAIAEDADHLPEVTFKSTPAVVRSADVPAGLPYREYRPYLRRDFWYSCAYCTMMESEAQALRFVIDHYEPRAARPDLEDVYDNLMYACDECNTRKGDWCPPEAARADGKRFYRPDQDVRSEHFRVKEDHTLDAASNTGDFTIEAVDLNRETLVTLRRLRRKLIDNDAFVSEGVAALAGYPIDEISHEFRARARELIDRAMGTVLEFYEDFDELLRKYAQSRILRDGDPPEAEVERNKERLSRLKKQEGMYPGAWRGRKTQKKRH